MSRTAVLIITLVVLSCALTGVQVGALWSQRTAPPVAAPQSPPALPDKIRMEQSLAANGVDQGQMLARLEQRLIENPQDHEARLLKGLLLFQQGRMNEAIDTLRTLTRQAPRFRLAHLVLGDLLLARFDQLEAIGSGALAVSKEGRHQLAELQNEARARLRGYLSLIDNVQVPAAFLTLSQETDYALAIDKSRHRLYVYKNSGPGLPPELIDNFYIVLGKETGDKFREGDLRTPNGVYFVTSYLPDEKLPPMYGSGAFPVDYPNEYDRRQRKTGNGIWLHGTDKSLYSRPPLDTEGCVVLTNKEFRRIRNYIETGRTPVVISEQLEWVSSREWLDRNMEVQEALESWRSHWEDIDIEAYLDMYSEDFWTDAHDKQSWSRYKKQVLVSKTSQEIKLTDITMLAYPDMEPDSSMVVANFRQHYRSNNFNGDMRKRLYLIKEEGRWQILYEGRQ